MKTWLSISIVAMLATSAGAQVMQSQDGRVLDSNYLVGGNGYNSVRQSNRIDSNLIVTRQVTRGFGFEGAVPYLPGNQLHAPLGTDTFDPFIRDSISVGQLGTGTVTQMGIFLAPDRTVLNANAIANRLNAPGSPAPVTAYVAPATSRRLYDSAVESYRAILPNTGQPSQTNPLITGQPVAPIIIPEVIPSAIAGPYDVEEAPKAAYSPLFGVIQTPEQQKKLADELAKQREAEREKLQQNDTDTEGRPLTGRIENPQPQSIDSRTNPLSPDARDLYPESRGRRADDTAPAGERPLTEPRPRPGQRPLMERNPKPTAQPQPAPGGENAPKPGQDAYYDLLLSMQPTPGSPTVRPDPFNPLTRRDGTEKPAEIPPGVLAVERTPGRIMLHRLAGAGTDQFNQTMRKAEGLMAAGNFYEASQEYELAIVLNRNNPLAHLGDSLALLAADEPRSAALQLERALREFPPLVETGVDVQKLLGKDLAKQRFSELSERLDAQGEKADSSLLMLAAFLGSSLGEKEKAVHYAQLLKKTAPEDKFLTVLADKLIAAGTTTAPK